MQQHTTQKDVSSTIIHYRCRRFTRRIAAHLRNESAQQGQENQATTSSNHRRKRGHTDRRRRRRHRITTKAQCPRFSSSSSSSSEGDSFGNRCRHVSTVSRPRPHIAHRHAKWYRPLKNTRGTGHPIHCGQDQRCIKARHSRRPAFHCRRRRRTTSK